MTPAKTRSLRERRRGRDVFMPTILARRQQYVGVGRALTRLEGPRPASKGLDPAAKMKAGGLKPALLRALRQPLMDRRRHFTLRAARHVDADVAALERKLGIVLGADVIAQRTRGRRRHQVILLGEDVED